MEQNYRDGVGNVRRFMNKVYVVPLDSCSVVASPIQTVNGVVLFLVK
jgi:hypothetical protein